MTIKKDEETKKPADDQAIKPVATEKKFPKPEIKIVEIDIDHVLFARNTT